MDSTALENAKQLYLSQLITINDELRAERIANNTQEKFKEYKKLFKNTSTFGNYKELQEV